MMETKELDLWFTEEHSKEAKFSIKVLKQLHSVQSPFQKIDIRWIYDGNRKR